MTFKIVNESILDQQVDAIVNPANSFMRHGGGLARIIADAATKPFTAKDAPEDASIADLRKASEISDDLIEAWESAHERAGLIPTGSSRITPSGMLSNCEYVIHAVGPIWGGGNVHEVELLRSAYDSAFKLAKINKLASVAVPAISAGIFGVPMEVVARVAVNAARRYAHELDITICLTSDEDVALFERYR